MYRIYLVFISLIFHCFSISAQIFKNVPTQWVDSVFNSLTVEEKIAQLFVVAAYTNKDTNHIEEIKGLITQYKIGGLCFFQNNAREQVRLTNLYQSLSKTPLMIFMDAEWGVGMRLDSVTRLPYQIMLGAMNDAGLVYNYGRIVARQFQRLGMQFNYAPVVDINNNPDNPVINYRSFGEDKEKIALMGAQYIRGLQSNNILASLKHFPGHGDVNTDSHYELPYINKTLAQIEKNELYPFRYCVENTDIGGVMIGHLNLPKIMGRKKIPSSVSTEIIKDLLIKKIGFKGLIFTDALNMEAFRKYIEDDKSSILALRSGNDMLCLVDNVPFSIKTIKEEMRKDPIFAKEIYEKVKKVLKAKYWSGLNNIRPISDHNIIADLNEYERTTLAKDIANNAITFVKMGDENLLERMQEGQKILYLAIGESAPNKFSYILRKNFDCNIELFEFNTSKKHIKAVYNLYKNKNPLIIIGLHNYGNSIKKNFYFSDRNIKFIMKKFGKFPTSVIILFGNPYAIKNFESYKNIIACYNNTDATQSALATILEQKQFPKGKLPFSINNDIPIESGITGFDINIKPVRRFSNTNLLKEKIENEINKNIREKAFPGAVIMAAHKGQIIYQKAFGTMTYDNPEENVRINTIYDVASITKGMGTTLAIMKLYEEGIIHLDDKISAYLPSLKSTDKANITIKETLLHESGLPAWLPYHKYTLNPAINRPVYANISKFPYKIPIAKDMYMNIHWQDSLWNALINVPLGKKKYVYSDIGFIFLGKMIENITQMPLDEYLRKTIYDKIGTLNTYFNPVFRIPLSHIAPTEQDNTFRHCLVHGYVHDYIAAMLGGVAGHAGLFSTAPDLTLIGQLFLNKGRLKNMQLFKPATIELFTKYSSKSRRSLGFDKPERTEPRSYPSVYASDKAFGHTGFTGTAIWIDPVYELVYVFLSNRIHPSSTNITIKKNKVREHILNYLYEYIRNSKP